MNHYDIRSNLISFHKFNSASAEDKVIEDLKAGQAIALISDAGTPLVSDPGQELVARCRLEGIEVTAVPGPCAIIDALVLSGLPMSAFAFVGFLPKKAKELQIALSQALLYQGTTVAYESPHRIEATLTVLAKLCPERKLCIARELTKLHEECLFGGAEHLLSLFKVKRPRGEIVLLISPGQEKTSYENLSLQELVAMLQQDLHLSKKDAIKMAAQMHKLPKREVYKLFNN